MIYKYIIDFFQGHIHGLSCKKLEHYGADLALTCCHVMFKYDPAATAIVYSSMFSIATIIWLNKIKYD